MKRLFPIFVMGLLAVGIAQSSWSAPTPIVEYLFNEGSGTTAINTGTLGSGTNGTIDGAIYSLDTISGSGFSLEFDGINDFVWVVDTFDYIDQLTIEAWIKPDATDTQRTIWDDYGEPGVLFTVWDGELQFNISTTADPGTGIGIFDGAINVDEWQHVAGIYDGSEMKVYINGVHAGDIAYSSGSIIDNGSNPAAIGSGNIDTSTHNFHGKIDDFRIFSAALDPKDLAGGYFVIDADFDADPIGGTAPLRVHFTDQSIGNISSWSWNFGDGSKSTAQNPTHTYDDSDIYTVKLTVSGPYGSDTEVKTGYITVFEERDEDDDGDVSIGCFISTVTVSLD